MKDGYIEQSDADVLMEVYKKINVVNGFVNEPLTAKEMTLIYAISKSIREGKVGAIKE